MLFVCYNYIVIGKGVLIMKLAFNIVEIGVKTFSDTDMEESIAMHFDKMYDYKIEHIAIRKDEDYKKCEKRYEELSESWMKTFREETDIKGIVDAVELLLATMMKAIIFGIIISIVFIGLQFFVYKKDVDKALLEWLVLY